MIQEHIVLFQRRLAVQAPPLGPHEAEHDPPFLRVESDDVRAMRAR
jgi:hypothetical protein